MRLQEYKVQMGQTLQTKEVRLETQFLCRKTAGLGVLQTVRA